MPTDQEESAEVNYDELLPDSRDDRAEWFWAIAGAFIGVGAAGAGTMWAGIPNWHLLVTGVLGYLCCVLFQWRIGVR